MSAKLLADTLRGVRADDLVVVFLTEMIDHFSETAVVLHVASDICRSLVVRRHEHVECALLGDVLFASNS